MKKIINHPEQVVDDFCRGMALAHPELTLHVKHRFFTRTFQHKNKVKLISGGGSGHEPAHAGFVGLGMLDAAVCGDIFASPSQVQIYHAIKEVASEQGVLLIIKNYSGDLMNFQAAADRAKQEGVLVDFIIVDDDIAVEDSLYTVGRRGVAGTVLVHKIAGAAAELGWSLTEVKRVAEKAARNIKSIGFALSSCTVPAKGTPIFELDGAELEYGVGIHGEPGIQRMPVESADDLAERMVQSLLKEIKFKDTDYLVMLVNGFGGTPLQELYILNSAATHALGTKNVTAYKTWVGNYMTSLEMAGASVTLFKMDEELKDLLAIPCQTPAFRFEEFLPNAEIRNDETVNKSIDEVLNLHKKERIVIKNDCITLQNIQSMVFAMSESSLKNEVYFCELDSHAGDGDFGMSLAKGFRSVLASWEELLKEASMEDFLMACSQLIMEHAGGASGPIWGSAFQGAGQSVQGLEYLILEDFAAMMQGAVKSIQQTGEKSFGRGAVVGDKTLIDALVPVVNSLINSAREKVEIVGAIKHAAKSAMDGAEITKDIVARMGRAGAVGERSLGYPDAGAYGLAVLFNDVANQIVSS